MAEPLADKERYMALLQGCGEVYLSAQAARNIHDWIVSLTAENSRLQGIIVRAYQRLGFTNHKNELIRCLGHGLTNAKDSEHSVSTGQYGTPHSEGGIAAYEAAKRDSVSTTLNTGEK